MAADMEVGAYRGFVIVVIVDILAKMSKARM